MEVHVQILERLDESQADGLVRESRPVQDVRIPVFKIVTMCLLAFIVHQAVLNMPKREMNEQARTGDGTGEVY